MVLGESRLACWVQMPKAQDSVATRSASGPPCLDSFAATDLVLCSLNDGVSIHTDLLSYLDRLGIAYLLIQLALKEAEE